MLSIDTNILFHGLNEDSPKHVRAYEWLGSLTEREDVAISEFVLAELYGLLRNPAVSSAPLSAEEAVEAIELYRRHPRWRLVGFPGESREVHDKLWSAARRRDFAFRRIYDARTALTLMAQGVTEFATTNEKDFAGLGFRKVWNPIGGEYGTFS